MIERDLIAEEIIMLALTALRSKNAVLRRTTSNTVIDEVTNSIGQWSQRRWPFTTARKIIE